MIPKHFIARSKPEHLSKREWKQLYKSMLLKPDSKTFWSQSEDGTWVRENFIN